MTQMSTFSGNATPEGQALDVPDGTVNLDAARDEVDERDEREGSGGGNGSRTRLHARNDANDVVDEDEEEQRRQEREVLLPGLADDGLAHVLLDELDDVLHHVLEHPVGNEAHVLDEREHDDKEQDGRHDHPEGVLGDACHQVADHRNGMEFRNQVVDLLWQQFKSFHDIPSLCDARPRRLTSDRATWPREAPTSQRNLWSRP